MTDSWQLFATCPKGLESLLAEEIRALGGEAVKETVAGVSTSGDQVLAYRLCLWSRLANSILMPLARVPADSAESFYAGVHDLDWRQHLSPGGCLWIEFSGSNNAIRHTQFGAQKAKDAIVDRLRGAGGERPSVDRHNPDLVVNIRLARDFASINLDLSGASLHRRGYRQHNVLAPLKQNLAAALLLRCSWDKLAAQGAPLIDPMCGSGTLLIEAAMMAADIAPAINRDSFGFERWPGHNASLWNALQQDAEARREAGLARVKQAGAPEIRGYDEDRRAVRATEDNSEAAGLGDWIRVLHKPLADFKRPTHSPMEGGLLITNPPYGERLGDTQALVPLYRQLGQVLRDEFRGWRAGVFTANPSLGYPSLGKAMDIRCRKKYKLYNGALPSELLLFDIDESWFVKEAAVKTENVDTGGIWSGDLSPGAQMVANRLRKNRKNLSRWQRGKQLDSYRLYDADLPEYAAAIDIYAGHVHIQEYAPPKSVDPALAQTRFDDTVKAVSQALQVPLSNISCKQRKRNRGREQYEKQSDANSHPPFWVREGLARFQVDLWSYLDTGIFPDHRLVRQKVAELACGKKLLNLFCYTATATVQAAMGGARESISVDMSKTYLDWAARNFRENDLSDKHQLVRADCLEWLHNCRQSFDVILLDPPSFSNSKRMEKELDVQRDHVKLIRRCVELLSPGGTLVFSTNLRSFKLDEQGLDDLQVQDISTETIDQDFKRNPKIHRCFLIWNV